MLHRNAAQKRLGIKPSALQTFQQLIRAQTAANGGMTPKSKQTQPGAPTATAGAAGIRSQRCTSLIPDRSPSTLPLSPTTHHAEPAPKLAAPTTMGKAQPECRAQQAPHCCIKTGNEQAGSSSLQLGGGSTPAAATPAAVRGTLQPTSAISLMQPGTPRMQQPARDLPFGAGHEQAELAMDPEPASSKEINSDDRKKMQTSTQTPEVRQLLKDHRENAPIQLHHLARNAPHLPEKGSEQAGNNSLQLGDSSTPAAASARCTSRLASTTWTHRTPHMHGHARDLPFGAGHEQAQLALDPLATSTKKINAVDRKKLQASTQVPEAHQPLKDQGEQASDKINRLARDTPRLPHADNYE